MPSILHDVYQRLFDRYGPQHWWPGESTLEILVGAVLVQNTNWRNVEQALDNLREEGLLSVSALYGMHPDELAEMIRPAGYYRLKAKRLRNVLRLVVEEYAGALEALRETPQDALREKLLAVNGIGPETADSILLYVLGMPTFVVDTYTQRVLKRHGWIEMEADYHAVQDYFHSSLERDAPLYNEFHALLVRVGREHCGKTPNCETCPLAELLPPSGVVSADWG